MARDTDRKQISEALRKQGLWRRETYGKAYPTGTYVEYVTDFDERLHVEYGTTGMVKSALYTHWDERGIVVSKEPITARKRDRVLELIRAGS